MTLNDILQVKGRSVHTIVAHASLADVVDKLVEHNVGSLVVCDGEGCMTGIITERDILRACAGQQGQLKEMPVMKHMTVEVITGAPQDDVETVMGLMTEHRIRHLPVLEQNRLVGIISIGDIVKSQYEHLSRENHYLMSYIQS
jgi:CBS domain-containing protein